MDSTVVLDRIDKMLSVKCEELELAEIDYAQGYYDHLLCISKLEEMIELHTEINDLEGKRSFYNKLTKEIMIDESK